MDQKKLKIVFPDEKNIFSFVESKKQYILGFLGLCPILYSITSVVYKEIYKVRCEQFYRLPGEYFDLNINNKLVFLGLYALLCLSCITPTMIRKYGEKTGEYLIRLKILQVVFVAIIGFEIGWINVLYLIFLMRQTDKIGKGFQIINYWLNRHAYIVLFSVTIMGLIAVAGINYIEFLRNIKSKLVKNIVCGICSISCAISIFLMITGVFMGFSNSVETKLKYEFVTNDSEYVVLSQYDGKLLVAPYEINDRGYVFKTNQYQFIDPCDGVYQYINIEHQPIIDVD